MKALRIAAIILLITAGAGADPGAIRGRLPQWAPDMSWGYDSLRNGCRLSDGQLRWYFENLQERIVAKEIDRDHDGVVDGMNIEVYEFIERMKIILSSRQPFEYRRDVWGNPVEYPSLRRDTKDST